MRTPKYRGKKIVKNLTDRYGVVPKERNVTLYNHSLEIHGGSEQKNQRYCYSRGLGWLAWTQEIRGGRRDKRRAEGETRDLERHWRSKRAQVQAGRKEGDKNDPGRQGDRRYSRQGGRKILWIRRGKKKAKEKNTECPGERRGSRWQEDIYTKQSQVGGRFRQEGRKEGREQQKHRGSVGQREGTAWSGEVR